MLWISMISNSNISDKVFAIFNFFVYNDEVTTW